MLFSELTALLENLPYRFIVDGQKEMVMAFFNGTGSVFPLTIQIQHECMVQVRVPMQIPFNQVPEASRLALMTDLMNLNFKRMIAKIGIDESDGEIVVYADLLFADNRITTQQLSDLIDHCLSTARLTLLAIVAALSAGPESRLTGQQEAIDQLMRQFGDRDGDDTPDQDGEEPEDKAA